MLNTNYNVIWEAHEGSQRQFLSCPYEEVLYHGTRGPGKTDALLMSYLQHVGSGYGESWSGIIFRKYGPDLEDIINKSLNWFLKIYPNAIFNKQKSKWTFPNGETLYFRFNSRMSDYYRYHGHAYPFIGWEELTNWSTNECYLMMMSCCRSANKEVPRMIRSTTNPYGPGHGWIEERFNLSGNWSSINLIPYEDTFRVAIHGHLNENITLLNADPDYVRRLKQSATSDEMLKAWLEGSWDIQVGGMFCDAFNPNKHIIKPFDIPRSWRIDRSFDWGSSAPFSVGWWAESDGTDYIDHNGNSKSTIRGDLFRIAEWYGCVINKSNEGLRMLASDIAIGIRKRESELGIRARVHAGVADSSIFNVENGNSIANDMYYNLRDQNNNKIAGVDWLKADKKPGSRILGWEHMRRYLLNSNVDNPEYPGLYIFDRCRDWIKIVPKLQRDEKNLDDIDTHSEDHIADETRYRIMDGIGKNIQISRTIGNF